MGSRKNQQIIKLFHRIKASPLYLDLMVAIKHGLCGGLEGRLFHVQRSLGGCRLFRRRLVSHTLLAPALGLASGPGS